MKGLTISISYTIEGFSCPEGKNKRVLVNSLAQAQREVREIIDSAGIGARDWSGGKLCLNGKAIGRVSYNGRAWTLSDTEMDPADPILGVYATQAVLS